MHPPPVSSSVVTWQVLLVTLCGLLATCSACFVRNCPPGGKRSVDTFVHAHRECLRCGPDGLGQCVGPSICCGHTIGCYVNSLETVVCRKENDVPAPCAVRGALCGRLGEARCVAIGVCCNDERCELDVSCGEHTSASEFSSNIAQKRLPADSHLSPEVVKFLRRIFNHKSFQKRK